MLTNSENLSRNMAAIISLIVGTLLMVVKFWAYNLTRSEAIRSDALESIVNIVTAAVAIIVVYYAAKPADEDHPYGHGKIEYFSSAFEGGIISFAGVFIVVDAIRSTFGTPNLRNLEQGLWIVFIAGVVNLILGLFLNFQGKKNKSTALMASGQHVISDSITSAGVLIGVGIVKITGALWLDAIVAMIVGVYLTFNGFRIVKNSADSLMDAEDESLLEELVSVFEKSRIPGIIQLHNVKLIRSGHYHHIDAHIVLPEYWTVSFTHEKINEFEARVIQNYTFNGEMNFHMDPCRKVYCKYCDLENCPIRIEKFKEKLPVNIDQLKSKEEPKDIKEGH
jgi:cation diffusion facilitator family transporter